MFKNVLVPVDAAHVERTDAMLRSVERYLEGDDVALTLLSVIPDVPAYVVAQLPQSIYSSAVDHTAATLTELIEAYKLAPSTNVKVVRGNPAQQILDYANEDGSDLIVIGSHQPGVADYLLGSVASKVVRHAKCSVLVIR